MRFKRKNKYEAPATIIFGKALNEKKVKQPCVWAQCHYAGSVVGPVWTHSKLAAERCLTTLTKRCQCGRLRHKAKYYEGERVLPKRD